MKAIDVSQLQKADYKGSVQNLYFLSEPKGYMVCETTSGGSVFDVGTIFSIEESGINRAAIRHKIYSLLSDPNEWKALYDDLRKKPLETKISEYITSGLAKEFQTNGAKTHHIGLVDKDTGTVYGVGSFPKDLTRYVLVKRYNVIKPKFINNQWEYSGYINNKNGSIIPLENIVRFGFTPASSLYKKYLKMNDKEKSEYLNKISTNIVNYSIIAGLSGWDTFKMPSIDFTTKYEPEDRNLSLREALNIIGSDENQFANINRMAILGSLMVSRFFSRIGLFLWDIKWELAIDNGELVFVDTIDTDSIRVTTEIKYNGNHYHVHFNKQSMRDYYTIKHPDWFEAVNKTKAQARELGVSFVEILTEGQQKGLYPQTPVVDKVFLEIQKAKQETIVSYIIGRIDIEKARKEISKIGCEELDYYQSTRGFEEIDRFNQIR